MIAETKKIAFYLKAIYRSNARTRQLGQAVSFSTELSQSIVFENEDIALRVDLAWESGFARIQTEVTVPDSGREVRLEEVSLTLQNLPFRPDREFGLGFSCWKTRGYRPPGEGGYYWRHGLIETRWGEGLASGFHLPSRWIHTFHLDGPNLIIRSRVGVDLAPGGQWRNDSLAIGRFLDMRGLPMPPSFCVARRRPEEVPAHGAWNSWDYFRMRVNASVLRRQMEFIRSHPALSQFVKYIIIDDGWQNFDGDWEADETKFPGGMGAIADEIRRAGFIPGLWAAPFFVHEDSRLFRERPELLLRKNGLPFSMFRKKGSGGLWGKRHFLDPTHPATRDHISKTWRKFRDWGFGYFKTDFLSNAIMPGLDSDEPALGPEFAFHDLSRGLLAPHRACMEAIREAIGEESFWLGCGSILPTGAGLMDASRMSGDIKPHREGLLRLAANPLTVAHTHGAVVLNDPDFLVVRGPETSDPECLDLPEHRGPAAGEHRQGPYFTKADAQAWASIVLLSGGLVTLSDDLTLLNSAGLDIIEKIIPLLNGVPAEILDPASGIPRALLRNNDGGGPALLGLFNWADAPIPALPDVPCASELAARPWRDVWSDEKLPPGALSGLTLAPGAHKLLLAVL